MINHAIEVNDVEQGKNTYKVIDKKTNKKFMLLSVLGIIFVVMGHCGDPHVFFSNVFPFYSFHMALFAFISGYFFKDRKVGEFLKHKTMKLLIPYFIWNAIYGLVILVLKKFNLITFGGNFTLYNIFISPFWSDSNQFGFNVAAWFVIAIYFVQIIYFFINKLLNKLLKLRTDIIVLIVSTILAVLELNMLLKGNINGNIKFLLTRVAFLMPFYAIGQVYKSIEKYDKLNNIIYFGIIFLIQLVILQKFQNIKYNLNILSFQHNYIIYFICSMTGIMFWLRISSIFAEFFSKNKIINYIGNNTHTIMMHHVFMIFVVNLCIYIININTGWLGRFNETIFRKQVWYSYSQSNPVVGIIYMVCGISVPLIIKYYVYDKIKIKIYDKFIKKENL